MMNNTFSPFPLWPLESWKLSRFSTLNQAYDPVYFRVFSRHNTLPSFYINDLSENNTVICGTDVEVISYNDNVRVAWIAPEDMPSYTYKNDTDTYLYYSGDPIANLVLPAGLYYLKIGNLYSEPFCITDCRSKMFIEASATRPVGGVPYHMGMISRIGIDAVMPAPTQETYEEIEENQRFGTRLTYQKLTNVYTLELQRVPPFLAGFLGSLRACSLVKIWDGSTFIQFQGTDMTIAFQKRNNEEATVSITAKSTSYEWADCDEVGPVVKVCEPNVHEYSPDDYDQTDYL